MHTSSIGSTTRRDEPTALGVTIVPAAPGVVAHVISVVTTEPRPTVESVERAVRRVVAWRIHAQSVVEDYFVEPILTQAPCSDERVFVEEPDGSLVGRDEDHRSVDDATAAVLAEAQADWDRAALVKRRA